MTDWREGYVTDIAYTYGYYTELNPVRSRLALLNVGITPPTIGTACELGFGQGVSINMHAAASSTGWSGTDFNPSQAGFAQELARISGANATLLDDSFAEFCSRDDLPNFDFIGLHGVWSWISDANRRVIVDFIRRKLNLGGVLYVSYNTMPGWANFAPMRDLMVQYERRMGAPGTDISSRIDSALAFADKMLATNPRYLTANPVAKLRFEPLKTKSRHYLAHEYFNQDWQPMYFADMANWMAEAKMSYACSAHYLDHVDAATLTAEHAQLLAEISDPILAESTRDFLVNQQFRKDYWVRGPRKLAPSERLELLRAERVMLVSHRAGVSLKVNNPMGEVTMRDDVYGPVLDVLADHQPKSIGEIEAVVADKGIVLSQIIEVVLVMESQSHIMSVQGRDEARASHKHARDLNSFLVQRAPLSSDIGFLASPMTGGGIRVSRSDQMFLEAVRQGKKTAGELAQHVWSILAARGKSIAKEGKALEGEEAGIQELKALAEVFLGQQLPSLKALKIAG
jgi:hypothetical protein